MLPGLRFNTTFDSSDGSAESPPIIERTKLISNIQHKLSPGSLLLICAEAGAGKSIFMQQLAGRFEQPSHLLDLGKVSSNPAVFLKLLIRAMRSVWPELNRHIHESHGHARGADPAAFLLNRLDTVLDAVYMHASAPAVLMIDSWDCVATSRVHNLILNSLLRKLPDFLTLMVATRWFPHQIEIGHLTIRGRFLHVGSEELRFDEHETARLLEKGSPEGKARVLSDKILALSGGWAAAVAFLAGHKELIEQEEPLEGGPRPFDSFVMEQFLAPLPEDMKKLMVYCAISQPFDEDLPASVFPSDLAEMLRSARPSIPFLRKNAEGLYELPAIVSNILVSNATEIVDSRDLNQFYLKLAMHLEKSWPERAFHLYLRSGHETFAWKLLKKHFKALIKRGQSDSVVTMLRSFDKRFMKKNPQAYFYLGEALMMAGQIDDAIEAMEQAMARLPKISKTWKKAGCMLAEAYLLKDRSREAADLCRRMLKFSPPLSYHNVETTVYLAVAYNQLGLKEEEKYWKKIESIANSKLIPLSPEQRCYLLTPKAAFYHVDRGEFDKAEEMLNLAIKVFKEKDPMNRLPWTLMFMGAINMETARPQSAAMWLRQAAHRAKAVNRSIYCLSCSMLALDLALIEDSENLSFWLGEAEKNLVFDTSIWSRCLSGLAALFHDTELGPSELEERLGSIMALAHSAGNSFLSYHVALASVKMIERIGDHVFVDQLIDKADKLARRHGIEHRRAALFLLGWMTKHRRNPSEIGHMDEELTRVVKECIDKGWRFLLVSPESNDCSPVVDYCLERGIEPEAVLSILPADSKSRLCTPFDRFASAPLKTRLAVADFWKNHNIKAAIPFIRRLKKESTNENDVKRLEEALSHLKTLPPDPLYLSTLGTFSVQRPYMRITAWKRKKARDLLKFLLINRGRPVPMSQLIETFWPDMDYKSAKTSLWSSMSALRATLEPELPPKAKSSYILIEDENYVLELPKRSYVDFEEFEELTRKGLRLSKTDQERCLSMLEKARRIYKGPFLPEDVYKDWTAALREKLALLYQDVLRTLARIYLERRQLAECLGLASELIEQDPWDEQAYLIAMQALVLKGQELQALRMYEKCQEVLKEELGLTPSQELENFKRLILKRRSCKILFKT